MSKHDELSAHNAIGLARELQAGIQQLQDESRRMERDISMRGQGANLRFYEAVEQAEQHRDFLIAQAGAAFVEEENALNERAAQRQRRLERARSNLFFALPRQVRQEKESWMGEQQNRHMEAGRTMRRDLESAAKEHAAKVDQVRETQQSLALETARARLLLGGFPSLYRKLGTPLDSASSEETIPYQAAVDALGKFPLAALFRWMPLWAWVLTAAVLAGGFAMNGQWITGIAAAVALLVFGVSLHRLALGRLSRPAELATIAIRKEQARLDGQANSVDAVHAAARARIEEEYENECQIIQKKLDQTEAVGVACEKRIRSKLDLRLPRALTTIERIKRETRLQAKQGREGAIASIHHNFSIETAARNRAHEMEETTLAGQGTSMETALQTKWDATTAPLYQGLKNLAAGVNEVSPEWKDAYFTEWSPAKAFPTLTRFGKLQVDLNINGLPANLHLPGPARVSVPVALRFPAAASLLIESDGTADEASAGLLNAVALRVLAASPPGKIAFTLLDPVGRGRHFAGLMHLADYQESLIHRRIWTQRDQIEERLAFLGGHIEKVIQMYLRNDYDNITAYNEQAGSVSEKYHVLVVADFPGGFSESACENLRSIITSGPRCGVFTLLHWNTREALPDSGLAGIFRASMTRVQCRKGVWLGPGQDQSEAGLAFSPEQLPEPGMALDLVHRIGRANVDADRVEVPFSQIIPAPGARWKTSTAEELRIPIGRTGATKFQELALGKGTRQHALFAGKTGSGKSTLFHVIITNLALACSPDEVEFYLIDFKKGVEFKCYASQRLPHARVVAVESDREFALSVLERVDAELRERGELFRAAGVQDLSAYRRSPGSKPMPRSLLIIDEFQEFFVEEDAVAQNASLLLDRIVRQGRAFGIHVLLGSQTLGGAYSLARATIGQMAVRVALQCNESDAHLIMDENNDAPRLLSRPGEGIYNDAGGGVEGNSPFQAVWISDSARDGWLQEISKMVVTHDYEARSPLVFEGNAPADASENPLLSAALEFALEKAPAAPALWLGAPNSIKGPAEAVFQRQNGDHLLMVGQREEALRVMLCLGMLALAAQFPVGTVRFHLFQGNPIDAPGSIWLEKIARGLPHDTAIYNQSQALTGVQELAAELALRDSSEPGPERSVRHFICFSGLHHFKKLRPSDDFSFDATGEESGGASFMKLLEDGAGFGLHVIATTDTLNNTQRSLGRRGTTHFAMRVLLQMSANDSATLIDSPAAAGLGLYRALLYHENRGTLETFRPYAVPNDEWIKTALDHLDARTMLSIS